MVFPNIKYKLSTVIKKHIEIIETISKCKNYFYIQNDEKNKIALGAENKKYYQRNENIRDKRR